MKRAFLAFLAGCLLALIVSAAWLIGGAVLDAMNH